MTKEVENCKTIKTRIEILKKLIYALGGFVLLFGYLTFDAFLENKNSTGLTYLSLTLITFTLWGLVAFLTFHEVFKLRNCEDG